MEISLIQILKNTLEVSGILFILLSAIFALSNSLIGEKENVFQKWFFQKWYIVHNSKFIRLPNIVFKWAYERKEKIVQFIDTIGKNYLLHDSNTYKYLRIFRNVILGAYVLIFYNYDSYEVTVHEFFLFPILTSMIIIFFVLPYDRLIQLIKDKEYKQAYRLYLKFDKLQFLIVIFSMVLFYFLREILQHDLYSAFLGIFFLLPFLWTWFVDIFINGRTIRKIENEISFKKENSLIFVNSVIFSFLITIVAMIIGNELNPYMIMSNKLQLFLSNALFDGLTLLVSFQLLKYAISGLEFYRIPLVVFIDLIIAYFFSLASIFFGLIGTTQALSFQEILFLSFGRSNSELQWEISPYFWIMYTTFIPTIFYCALVLVSWLGKLVIIPLEWFLGKGKSNKRPLGLSSALFATIGAVFGLFSYVLNKFH